MPSAKRLKTVRHDVVFSSSTVTKVSAGAVKRQRRQASRLGARSGPVVLTQVHPLLLAEVRRRTTHLTGYHVEYLSPTAAVIRSR